MRELNCPFLPDPKTIANFSKRTPKFLPLTTVVATLALLLFSPDAASAKGFKPRHKPTPVPEKVNASGSTISKIGGDSITIEYSKTSTTYKMSNETQITIDGQRARSTDLKPGMHAEVGVSKITPTLLLSIAAHR